MTTILEGRREELRRTHLADLLQLLTDAQRLPGMKLINSDGYSVGWLIEEVMMRLAFETNIKEQAVAQNFKLLAGHAELTDRLRGALKPFAEVAEHDIGADETDADLFRPITHHHAPLLTVGDLRRARAVLQPKES